MKKIILFICLFSGIKLYSQSFFTVKYSSQADLKVFVVDYPSQADLKVFKVKYKSQAKNNSGLWFFVDYKSQADKNIYFVNYKSQAGWNNLSKKYLIY